MKHQKGVRKTIENRGDEKYNDQKPTQQTLFLLTLVCRKYRGNISLTNRSLSRTTNASPRGNHDTILASSFCNISNNLRGNGLECPFFDDFFFPVAVEEVGGEPNDATAGEAPAAAAVALGEEAPNCELV